MNFIQRRFISHCVSNDINGKCKFQISNVRRSIYVSMHFPIIVPVALDFSLQMHQKAIN